MPDSRTITILVDSIPIETTQHGAGVIQGLQAKLRSAQATIDGLQGQVDALRAMSPQHFTPHSDARAQAAAARAGAERRLTTAWQNDHRPLAAG